MRSRKGRSFDGQTKLAAEGRRGSYRKEGKRESCRKEGKRERYRKEGKRERYRKARLQQPREPWYQKADCVNSRTPPTACRKPARGQPQHAWIRVLRMLAHNSTGHPPLSAWPLITA